MKEIIEDSLLFNANDIFSGCFAFEPTRKLYIQPVQINAESTIYNQNCKPFKFKNSQRTYQALERSSCLGPSS
jgi:hypothetical protein